MTTPFNPYANTDLLKALETNPNPIVRNSVELGALDTLPDGVYRTLGELEAYLDKILEKLGDDIVPLVEKHTPVYSGKLSKSAKFKISNGPLYSRLTIDKQLEFYQDAVSHGREFSGSSTGYYWQYVAFGRPPGTSPKLIDLRGWVRAKIFGLGYSAPESFRQDGFTHAGIRGGQPGFYTGPYDKKTRRKGQKFRRYGPSLAQIERVTYAIAQNLGARGSTQWQKREPPYYLKAIEEGEEFIQAAEAKLGRQIHASLTGWQPYSSSHRFRPPGGIQI